jgi:hypothetical protein
MKKISRGILVFVMLMAISAALVAGVIIKERPTAQSNGTDIIVRWVTVDETGVQKFEVLRRSGMSGDFFIIGTIDQLKGNNSTYEYVDKSVFKSSAGLYQYKIRVINGETPAPETEIVTVSHLASAAKRTWGSIKALFR